ncbi:NUDIX hydrolase [Streptomyces sp. NPDC058268]|uniref:NUDIX hydrolase n=1 Tax=Streptomyces sp. NPDC058268 TaxID=3346413 RepID=UPI0036ED2CE6
MAAAPLREAARVIVLDNDQRVLLLRYDENEGFWATPGGSLETGETYTAAALRELHEELGIDTTSVVLGTQLAERSQEHAVGGREVRQVERYFPAHLTAADVDASLATQPDNIREHRWWTLDELRATHETVYPLGLADLTTDYIRNGVPDRPVVLL